MAYALMTMLLRRFVVIAGALKLEVAVAPEVPVVAVPSVGVEGLTFLKEAIIPTAPPIVAENVALGFASPA